MGLEGGVGSPANAVAVKNRLSRDLDELTRAAAAAATLPADDAGTLLDLTINLHQATQALQSPADGSGPAAGVHAQLVQLGSELQAGTDGYTSAVAAGDFNQLQAVAGQLSQTAEALSPALVELNALGSAYALGD